MRIILISIILLSVTKFNSAQIITEWFPTELNVQPFTANILEPKVGFQYLFKIEKVRIDIGTSHDLVKWKTDEQSFSIGADFFTYTRARSEDNFKFPVETIDYMFGINGGFKSSFKKNEWGARLRLSHISAHLVDGYYDSETQKWLDGREPFVFSKEFIELMGYYKTYGLRVYAGFTYNFHIIPEEIKKGILQIGFDYYSEHLRTSTFTPFIAYDFKLTGIEKYSGNNIISAGIKFGESTSRGFSILISYFSGKSVHGEFYDLTENYASIGINLDI
ncbi:MAG: DUF1207 domain-containing protein [Ignavibacteria bacterium]|nr:DUF1207 domain-containing protein [Ignavibacteria bacterium]MBT8383172.1 DUF1207 domain-containing protein [Ignavibacteria bacterium]MBT8390824.1 DUF1207 domain-containing protein [Ignavibacteria bacterium]NNJ53281.1 DUF1207 domain-containing protein [Ignavibacteriaceae bacterium]NNL22365.1 DUF1207 domain-containing protein [Ignavibacteriaceae bacterium]